MTLNHADAAHVNTTNTTNCEGMLQHSFGGGKILGSMEQVTKPDSALDGQGVYYPVLPPKGNLPQVITIISVQYKRVLVDAIPTDGADGAPA